MLRAAISVLFAGLGLAANAAEPLATTPVTQARLLRGTSNTAEWLLYGGNYNNWRFSPLQDVNRDTVGKMQAAWVFQTGVPGQLEASPVVADGVLFLTAAYNNVYALDAVSGTTLWKYTHQLPADIVICCGPTNRGVAISGDAVIMGTLDAHLVALDRKTGKLLWNTEMAKHSDGFSATSAPLVIDDLVFMGIAGGEYGARGFVDAYEVKTGKHRWRRYTVPVAGEPGIETWAGDSWKVGGGSAWGTGAYDPDSKTLYWATGNPSPDWNGDTRAGDNLYSDSALALDVATGEVKWHFQFTPHDVWDYDGTTGMFLIDTPQADGSNVKTLLQPNRNGYLYALDASTGKFLHGKQYVDQLTWATGLDVNGRALADPKFYPMPGGNPEWICPGSIGGQNGAYTAAYSPATKLVYVPVVESCGKMEKQAAVFLNGTPFWGGGPGEMQAADGSSYGHLSAYDALTGERKWSWKDEYPMVGGTLATAGGLVFSGNQSGHVLAFDDTTGKVLWRFQTGSAVRGQPITYKIGGRQYVAFGSGGGGLAIQIVGQPPLDTPGSALLVFALPP
ncbi:MAG: PQQ-dependent dehydrogenase, methanol/ethanol family [Gammaproteobacteria bacterium]|nr:PQQ-dependent dehydrogenase, methanol/ethanol family [Gammaproteobacteria bacterium]